MAGSRKPALPFDDERVQAMTTWARPVNSSNASRRSLQPAEFSGPPFSADPDVSTVQLWGSEMYA